MSKFVIIALFIISTSIAACYIVPQYQHKKHLEEKAEERQMEFVSNKKEILKRQTLIQDLNDNPDAINRIAREKFRLCNPGERVYKFTDEDLFQKSN